MNFKFNLSIHNQNIFWESSLKPVYLLIFFLSCFFINSNKCRGQSKEAQLLKKIDIAGELAARNPDSCDLLLDEVYRENAGKKYHKVNIKWYHVKANKCMIEGDIEGTTKYFQKAYDYVLKNVPEDTTNLIGFKFNLATLLYVQDKHFAAYKELLRLNKFLRPKVNSPIQDSVLWYHCQITLSLCLVEIGREAEAMKNWKESLPVLESKLPHPKYERIYTGMLLSYATTLLKSDLASTAIIYYKKLLPFLNEDNRIVDRFSVYNDLAKAYNILNLKDSTLKYLKLSEAIIDMHSEPRTKADYYVTYAEYYTKNKEYKRALVYINQAINFIEYKSQRPEFYKIKADILQKMGNSDSALASMFEYVELRDTQLKNSREKLVYELDEVYKSGDLKNKLNQETIQRKQMQLIGEREKSKRVKYQLSTISILLFFSSFIIIYRLRAKHRRQIEAKKIQRDLLLARMDGQDFEKERIARDLHDSIVNDIMNVFYKLDNSESLSEPNIVDELKQQLRLIKDDIRDFAYDIAPSHLLHADFINLFRSNLKVLTDKGMNVQFINEWPAQNYLSEFQKIELIKMIKEITNNLRTHSIASDLKVSLVNEGEKIAVIEFKDNGKAYRLSSNNWKSLGMNSLFKRASAIQAKISNERQLDHNVFQIRIQLQHPEIDSDLINYSEAS